MLYRINEIAEENEIKEIAFPCIGMGIYKCPLEIGAKIAVDIVKSKMNNFKFINKVYFVCGNKEQFEVYTNLVKES